MPPQMAEIIRASRSGSSAAPSGVAGPAKGLTEVGDYTVNPEAARDGDAIPAPLAVMGESIAGVAEGADGRVGVGELRLLHQKHVGVRAVEPPFDLLETSVQGVDVPRRDAHESKNTSSGVRRPARSRG